MANYYAVAYPMFQPAMRCINAITQANPAVFTTTTDHQYQTGLIVRINVPKWYGMQQINKFVGEVNVLTPTTFSLQLDGVPLDTTTFDPFVVPVTYLQRTSTPAQCVPVGEVNDMLIESTKNVLPYP
jgi:hypothetical protein